MENKENTLSREGTLTLFIALMLFLLLLGVSLIMVVIENQKLIQKLEQQNTIQFKWEYDENLLPEPGELILIDYREENTIYLSPVPLNYPQNTKP